MLALDSKAVCWCELERQTRQFVERQISLQMNEDLAQRLRHVSGVHGDWRNVGNDEVVRVVDVKNGDCIETDVEVCVGWSVVEVVFPRL